MDHILSKHTASISELKASPTKLLKQAKGEAIAILNHNTPSAYLVPAKQYEKLLSIVDDYLLTNEIDKRLNDNSKSVNIDIDRL